MCYYCNDTFTSESSKILCQFTRPEEKILHFKIEAAGPPNRESCIQIPHYGLTFKAVIAKGIDHIPKNEENAKRRMPPTTHDNTNKRVKCDDIHDIEFNEHYGSAGKYDDAYAWMANNIPLVEALQKFDEAGYLQDYGVDWEWDGATGDFHWGLGWDLTDLD